MNDCLIDVVVDVDVARERARTNHFNIIYEKRGEEKWKRKRKEENELLQNTFQK